jgi:hypothetical protein
MSDVKFAKIGDGAAVPGALTVLVARSEVNVEVAFAMPVLFAMRVDDTD